MQIPWGLNQPSTPITAKQLHSTSPIYSLWTVEVLNMSCYRHSFLKKYLPSWIYVFLLYSLLHILALRVILFSFSKKVPKHQLKMKSLNLVQASCINQPIDYVTKYFIILSCHNISQAIQGLGIPIFL